MNIVAFEIDLLSDTMVLRAVIGRVQNRQFRVVDTVLLDEVRSADQLGDALRDRLQQRKIDRAEAVAVVSRRQAEIREITVPPAPDDELPDMVRFQAKNEFVSLTDSWLLDFLPFPAIADQPRRVLAAAVAPETRERIEAVCSAARLNLQQILFRPLASIDLLSESLLDGEDVLLVQSWPDHADLTVARGGSLQLARTIAFPAEATAEQRASKLISETRRTLASTRTMPGDIKISKVLIVGDPKRYKAAEGDFRNQLNLDVGFVSPFQLAPVASQITLPEQPAAFASLLGALVAWSNKRKPRIDFLHPRQPVVVRADHSRLYLYGGLALAATLLAIVFCWWTLSSQAAEIAALQNDVNEAIRVNQGADNRPGVDQIMGEVGAIDRWKADDVNWLQELHAFSDRMLTPDDAIVDSLIADQGRSQPRFTIRSRVTDIETETQLLNSLADRPYRIIPSRSVEDTTDTDYPLKLDFSAELDQDLQPMIQKLNQRATEFLQQTRSSNVADTPVAP